MTRCYCGSSFLPTMMAYLTHVGTHWHRDGMLRWHQDIEDHWLTMSDTRQLYRERFGL